MGQARLDRAALSRRQRRGGQVPVFVEPGHHLAVSRIDNTVAEPQPVVMSLCCDSLGMHTLCIDTLGIDSLGIDAKRGALDMKAGTGAQFANETGIEPARQISPARQIAEPKFVGEIRLRLFHPVEVVGDREMLGHVALPGRHAAAIGFGPMRHRFTAMMNGIGKVAPRRVSSSGTPA